MSTDLPLLEHITESNQSVINSVFNKVQQKGEVFVVDGLTFKEDIDDLRRSPFVKLVENFWNVEKLSTHLTKMWRTYIAKVQKSKLSFCKDQVLS